MAGNFISRVLAVCIIGSTSLSTAAFAKSVNSSQKPSVQLKTSLEKVIILGDPLIKSLSCKPTGTKVKLTAITKNLKSQNLLHDYIVSGGRISDLKGATATWEFEGVRPGYYTVTLEVKDVQNQTANVTKAISVEQCK